MNNNSKIMGKENKLFFRPKKIMRWFLFLLAMLFYIILMNKNASAQGNDDRGLGEEKIFITNEYQPTITNAIKITDNPVLKDSAPQAPSLKYGVLPKQMTTEFKPQSITHATIKGEPLTKLYNSYAKAGAGNYSTFYSEYFYNSLRSKKANYGIHAKHLSSSGSINNTAYPGISDNAIDAYGKMFLKDYTLSGDAFYNRNVVHYYGYDRDYRTNPLRPVLNTPSDSVFNKKDIYQRFALFGANALLESETKDSLKLKHTVALNYYSLYDAYNAAEHNIKANGYFGKYYDKEFLHGNILIDYYRNENSLNTANTTILGFNPKATLKGDKWLLDIGVLPMIGIQSTGTTYHFYPDVFVSYRIADRFITAFAGATGKLHRNSYKEITGINPFVQSAINLQNTNTKIEVYGGIKGSLSSATSYVLGADYSVNNGMPLFVNYESNFMQNKFIVIYDNVKQTKLSGELYHQKTEKLSLSAKANYYSYKPETEKYAWHKPNFDGTVSVRYNLQDKIIARLDVFYISQQYAKLNYFDTSDSTYKIKPKTLKGIADINLGFEYRYNKKISAFINFNNIGHMRYYRWNNYPIQRFNFLAGLSFTF